MLDRRDFAPVVPARQQDDRKTAGTGRYRRGYEYEKGEHVVVNEEDFRQANVKATQTIDIQGLVEPGLIPAAFYEQPYYLSADKRGEKVYTLLREALVESNTVAIALIVLRTRQYVCALLPVGKTILLNTLRYADEVLPAEQFAPAAGTLEQANVSRKEFDTALKLVEHMRITPAAAKASELGTAEVVDLGESVERSLAERRSSTAGSARDAAVAANRTRARGTTLRRSRRA